MPLQLAVDKNNLIPIYRQIEEAIRVQILSGSLSPYDLIPSENELSQSLEVSPMTVRQAMSALVQAGYIYRERGKGTYVAPRHIEHPLTRMVGFSEDMAARGLQPGTQILAFERIEAGEEVAQRLAVAPGSLVLHIKRLRLVNGHPVGLHDAYLRELSFDQAELEACGSLYRLLEQRGLGLGEAQDEIEAVAATEEHRRLLHVGLGSPLLMVQRVAAGTDNQPLELVYAVYRSDFYRYKIQLKR